MLPAVILGTPVITAIGGITGGSGIQRNKANPLDIPATPLDLCLVSVLDPGMRQTAPLVLWIPEQARE